MHEWSVHCVVQSMWLWERVQPNSECSKGGIFCVLKTNEKTSSCRQFHSIFCSRKMHRTSSWPLSSSPSMSSCIFFNYLFASTSTSTRRNAQIMNGSRWSKTMKIENENEKRNKKKNARRNSIDFGWLTTTLMRCERLFNFINRRKLNERTTERQNERKPN